MNVKNLFHSFPNLGSNFVLQKHMKYFFHGFNEIFQLVQPLSLVRLFATPCTAARQASLSITNSRSPSKPMSIESMMQSNHLILCHPLLLLSIFPRNRVFSSESRFCIRWPIIGASASATVLPMNNQN